MFCANIFYVFFFFGYWLVRAAATEILLMIENCLSFNFKS